MKRFFQTDRGRRAVLALLLALAFALPALAQESGATALPADTPAAVEPKIVIDDDNGYWLYESKNLRVEITRKTDPETPLVWFEADLRTTPATPLACVLSAEKNPVRHLKKPDAIAKRDNLVYAQTDDFFGDRVSDGKQKAGVVVRAGRILYDNAYHGNGRPFPPLDTMAIFPDGTLEVFSAKEYTADQYLVMGAQDVLSFGPILIRDGVMDARLEKGYTDREPRSAIGMIAPYHYFAVVVEGRHADSRGCGLRRIAERMLEVGVTEALNLDGGQTAAMVFMGRQLNLTGKFKRYTSVRSVSGVLGIKDAP